MTTRQEKSASDIARIAKLREDVESLSKLLQPEGMPNINALWQIAKDLEGIKLNIKQSGYTIARRLVDQMEPASITGPVRVDLKSKACTQADIESDWLAYWADRLKIKVIYHRKIWEYCYVLQALWEHGVLTENARGLGFACGEEPLPSLLARNGCNVLMSDLPQEQAKGSGWMDTNQHAANIEIGHKPYLVDRDTYLQRVDFIPLDMNVIPDHLHDFDFCWSICSFEHLGSITKGLDFVENSLATLRPGGVAVHTTEYNFLSETETIDNWGTVLFLRQHFETLVERLRAKGHTIAELDFNVGDGPMDGFIDLPPYQHDLAGNAAEWVGKPQHLKLLLDGFASTCFGLIIIRSDAA